MADEKTPKAQGSITQKADESGDRISEVSNVSRTINQMQKKVNQELSDTQVNVGDYERIEEVQNSMIKVLSNLSSTIGSVGQGFAKVAGDTAQASKDAVQQYGKAISQDISFNKQNVVAMALARSSPIFGYFAAKFVETDVFKSAKEKMKANIADALSGVTSKFKQGFGRLLGGGKATGTVDKELRTMKTAGEGAVPKMQSGGYVERAGLAYVHPAEVVMPIEKVLEKIDQSIDTTKELANISRQAQLKTMAKMTTYVQGVEHMEKVGLFKGFVRALSDVQTRHTQPAEKRMLRAVLAIQDSMGATIGTWPQVWQKMLVEHPTFRNMMFALNSLKNIIGTPIDIVYQAFKSRGGYQSHLSRSRNPMEATAENIGLVYTEGMWRLDNIAMFTRATAEATRDMSSALTGKTYKPLEGMGRGTFTLFGLARGLTNAIGKWGPRLIGGALFGKEGWKKGGGFGDFLTKDRESFVTTLLDKLPGRQQRKGVYGIGGLLEGSNPELESASKPLLRIISDKKAVPVIDVNAKKLLEYQEDAADDSEKTKAYLRDLLDVSEEMNDREERRSFFAFLTGGGGIVKGLLSTVMGFLGPIFSGGISGMIGRSLRTGFLGALKHPSVIAGIGAAFGPPLAAAFGYAVGKQIDEMLGISKSIQGSLDKLNERARLNAAQTSRDMMDDAKTASQIGGAAGFKAQRKVREMAAIGKVEGRHKDMGWLGQNHLLAIDNAQRQYIAEHMDSYSNYNPDEILMLRKKWIQAGGMRGRGIGEDPHMYGLEREKAFHTYLYRNAMKMDTWEREALEKSYHDKFKKAHPVKTAKEFLIDKYSKGKTYLFDKATGVYKDVSKLAADEVEQLLAQGAVVVNELQAQGDKALDTAKKTTGALAQGMAQSATMINTNISNATKIVSSGANKAYNEMSEYTQAVTKGNLFED